VAYSTTRAEYEADQNSSSDSGSSYTVPIVVVGCLIGVLGAVAAVVVIRKRKAAAEEVETDYSNAIRTPAV
jgi:flagellar basal body-associated protein FliL